eukprot:229524-Prorocentrum_minimum.AAC.1
MVCTHTYLGVVLGAPLELVQHIVLARPASRPLPAELPPVQVRLVDAEVLAADALELVDHRLHAHQLAVQTHALVAQQLALPAARGGRGGRGAGRRRRQRDAPRPHHRGHHRGQRLRGPLLLEELQQGVQVGDGALREHRLVHQLEQLLLAHHLRRKVSPRSKRRLERPPP